MTPIVASAVALACVIALGLGRGPVAPTTRFCAVIATVAIAAIFVPPWISVVAASGVVALAFVDALAARTKRPMESQAPRMMARAVPAELRATVRAPRGTTATIRQAQVPDVRVTPSVRKRRLRAQLVALRRGRHVLPGTAARVTGPLGLAWWRVQPSPPHELHVYPDLPAARRIAAAVRRDHTVSAGVRIRGPIGLGTEFDAIREYQPDDDIRMVNWRATARTGHPMSNRYRVEQDRDVLCVVDCGRLMGAPLDGPGGARTRLDAALDAVAAMAMVADAVGDRIGVLAFDQDIRRQLRPHRAGADRVVRAIYDLEPSLEDADYDMALRIAAGMKRALVVVFTDLIDDAAARSLLEALPTLAAKHAVIVASPVDDDVDAIVHTRPTTVDDAYRMAAALDVITARDVVRKKIEQRGAEVVQAELVKFSPSCVRAYLFAKQRARI